MLKKRLYALVSVLVVSAMGWGANEIKAQVKDEDALFIRQIYDAALTQGKSYEWLDYLCNHIGHRLSGSAQAAAAVEYTRQMLDTLGLHRVSLQPCIVPHWERGETEVARIVNSSKMGTVDLHVLALGNSEGTGPLGITAEVVEVKSLDEVDRLGTSLTGKIVFFNRPVDPRQINTFNGYGGAVDQRAAGATRASKYGAVGVLVRSVTPRLDDIPHSGSMYYEPGVNRIPAFGLSTNDSELLHRLLQEEPVRVFMRNTSRMLASKPSHNVIGEIKGSEYPEEIILVGGHLDSWDLGTGAHDDGAGCVQAMDVLQIFKRMNYTPKRTLRCVLFMNEENGGAGSIAYEKESSEKKEYHMAAIESDRGGFTPRGFTFEGEEQVFDKKFKKVYAWSDLLEPYGLFLKKGGSGADIARLKIQKGLMIGFEPDSQRYFDIHHTAQDVFQEVNKRELELGVAAMASLVYLLDKYGL